ncbi:alpha/beta hydrolase family protein [Parasediminibacterium paludis]|uniref:Alpha/beta hydrolase family protein n=1 Tax=Parasediminibacterium paludis TaxID=908966 RepID=A0ABV8PXS0_9BACT
MKKIYVLFLIMLVAKGLLAQKKPLDHSVYDGWQTLAEKLISNDGKLVVYTVTPQEGDATLVIQLTNGKKLFEVERGYNARITEDNKYVIFKIKPTFTQTRAAKIAKKVAADTPKDSLAIVDLTTSTIEKIPAVKSYKLPEKASNVLLYLLEKPTADTTKPKFTDSVKTEATAAAPNPTRRGGARSGAGASNDGEEGTELVVKYLAEGQKTSLMLVNDYVISKTGNVAVIKTTKKNSDVNNKAFVLQLSTNTKQIDTVLKAFNDAKSFTFDDAGKQLAFVAERDSAKKESQKFYKLYYYKAGLDSAKLLADRSTKGVPAKHTISEFASIDFSKSGKRLFIGTSVILPSKDTTLPEFERAGVDVWNYHDDDLMTVQLKNVEADTRKSYLARYDFESNSIVPLADDKFPRVQQTLDGDGEVFYTSTDFGRRIARQWQGSTFSDLYNVNPITGERKLILANFKGNVYPSYTGKFLLIYEDKKKAYTMYNSATQKLYAVATDIKYPLYDEENDVPDDPNPYGIAKWMEGDKYVLINDHYDVWKVATEGTERSIPFTFGRYNKIVHRHASVDADEKFIKNDGLLLFRLFDEKDKSAGLAQLNLKNKISPTTIFKEPVALGTAGFGGNSGILKAKDANLLAFTKETFETSPNLYVRKINGADEVKLSNTNPQQANYNWGTSELFKWKAYTGKETEGVLYKPEDFDPKKKYPMIVYFYERNNETLHNYRSPAPTASALNIPFFVSRGYIVLVPDIWYKIGHPGKSAFDYIVSGTRAVVKAGFVDSTKIGIQGQSWGGYQTAYVITQTNLYAAAWAGAPVVNMFSAYGGIRWESGVTRQFQYEKTQSRIGATIWEKPELYIENSPLFHLPKVKTPLVIMSNDADGAVPWYQGIEYFTAMRRLNKPVWLLVYNGEAHNLVERRNRKDLQIREQQYFDWLLKGEKPTKWLTEGVPAVMKGRDWGLGN